MREECSFLRARLHQLCLLTLQIHFQIKLIPLFLLLALLLCINFCNSIIYVYKKINLTSLASLTVRTTCPIWPPASPTSSTKWSSKHGIEILNQLIQLWPSLRGCWCLPEDQPGGTPVFFEGAS